MHEIVINWFVNFPKGWATFLIAIIPVTELRASIPLAVKVYDMHPFLAWFYSVMGTFFAMILIVFLLDPVSKILSKYISFSKNFFNGFLNTLEKKLTKKCKNTGYGRSLFWQPSRFRFWAV